MFLNGCVYTSLALSPKTTFSMAELCLMTGGTCEEDRVKISLRWSGACPLLHLSISENGIIRKPVARAPSPRVYEHTAPRGSAGMAEVKSINTHRLVFFFWPLNKNRVFFWVCGVNGIYLRSWWGVSLRLWGRKPLNQLQIKPLHLNAKTAS